jgi:hypothetical protein
MLDFAVTVVYGRVTDFPEFVFELAPTGMTFAPFIVCARFRANAARRSSWATSRPRRQSGDEQNIARFLGNGARRQDVCDRECRGERTDAVGRAFRRVDGATA